jgi:hypothetical protein
MKKLMVAGVLVAAVFGGWRWRHTATDGHGRNLAINRLWVDHLPANERDVFNVFIVHAPEGMGGGVGGFAEETMWKGQIERFRFDIDADTLHAVFPWTDTHEDIKLTARPCHEQGMEYCLELSGTSHGVSRYYSRTGWKLRAGEDVDALKARIIR